MYVISPPTNPLATPVNRIGWQCPRCKVCYAPEVKSCSCNTGLAGLPLPGTVHVPFYPQIKSSSGSIASDPNVPVLWNSGCGNLLVEN